MSTVYKQNIKKNHFTFPRLKKKLINFKENSIRKKKTRMKKKSALLAYFTYAQALFRLISTECLTNQVTFKSSNKINKYCRYQSVICICQSVKSFVQKKTKILKNHVSSVLKFS